MCHHILQIKEGIGFAQTEGIQGVGRTWRRTWTHLAHEEELKEARWPHLEAREEELEEARWPHLEARTQWRGRRRGQRLRPGDSRGELPSWAAWGSWASVTARAKAQG